MDLDQFVGWYPDQFEPGAAYNLATKKEFYDYHATPSEPGHKPGTAFKHQENFARLIESGVVSRILNIDETGTGKTCKFGYAAERVKQLLQLGDLRGKYKKAVVLVPGRILRDEIANQLVCSCTQGVYDIAATSTATTDQGIRKVITTNLAVFYQIETYGKFANQVINNFASEEALIEEFSNTIFLCDEIHSLNIIKAGGNNPVDSGKWNTKPAERTIKTFQEFVEKKALLQQQEKGRGVANKNTDIYSLLWLLFHKIRNSVVILSSATPAINNINELTPVCNLLLPEERQINFDLSRASEEDLVPYFNGLFTFTRALDTGIDVIDAGDVIDQTFTLDGREYSSRKKVFYTQLSEFHSDAYRRALNAEGANFKIEIRQLAKGVFPDGTSGGVPSYRKGSGTFGEWILSPEENKYRFSPKMLTALSEEGALDKYFGPIANAIRISISEPGGAFYYFEYAYGIGAILGGLLAEYIYNTEYRTEGASRAERFAPESSVIAGTSKIPKLCSSRSGGEQKIKISKRFRYAIITNETPQRQIEHILALRNHPDNVNGEYLALVFGSPISRDGININGLADIHIMFPAWTAASEYQAKSRGIRAKSHEERLRVDRENMREQGFSEEEIQEHRPSVRVFHHAGLLDDGELTEDTRYYINAEKKDIVISRVMRIAKQCAIDYYLNKKRNIRKPEDHYVPWGLDANGEPVEYPEDLDGQEGSDVSTYDIYYAKAEIDNIIAHIRMRFKQKYLYTLDRICESLPEHRRKLVVSAVVQLIENRQIITDKYGFAHYLVLMNNYLAITRDYPVKPFNYTGAISTGLTTTTLRTLASIAKEYINKITEDKAETILEGESLDVNELVKLDNEATAKLIETAISKRWYLQEESPLADQILDHYASSLDWVYYPTTLINQYSDYYESRMNPTGAGARAKTKYDPKKVFPYIDEGDGEVFAYHVMLTRPNTSDSAYNLNAWLRLPLGTIRMMSLSTGEWRNAEPEEEAALRSHAVDKYNQKRLSITTFSGKYSTKTKKLFIVNIAEEKRKYGTTGAKDHRTSFRGHVCETYHVEHISKLLTLLGLDADDFAGNTVYSPIEADFSILSDLTEDQLQEFYKWYGLIKGARRYNKAQACGIIHDELKDRDLIEVID